MYNRHISTDTMLHIDITDGLKFPVYMEGLCKESEWLTGNKTKPFALWHCGSVKMWGCFKNILGHILNYSQISTP